MAVGGVLEMQPDVEVGPCGAVHFVNGEAPPHLRAGVFLSELSR